MSEKLLRKDVMLTFQNMNKNKVNLYVKDGEDQPERRIKTVLSMALYTIEKGKAFAYQ